LETAAASIECDALEIEAFEVAPVKAAATGNEKSHSRANPKLCSFSVFDKLKFVRRQSIGSLAAADTLGARKRRGERGRASNID